MKRWRRVACLYLPAMSPRVVPAIGSDTVERVLGGIAGSVSARIRTERLRRRWSQAELAARAGVPRQVVQAVEQGRRSSLSTIVAMALALRLEVAVDLRDRPAARRMADTADAVHAAMAEAQAAHLRQLGFRVAIDEPYQRYRFAGRADLVAWRTDPPALLHIENRTRFPDIQEMAGAWNAKCTWLGDVLADRHGIDRWQRGTHVLACLWSQEVIDVVRRHPATFRALAPDPDSTFAAWWRGDVGGDGRDRTFILVDPAAPARRVRSVGLDAVIDGTVSARYRGYADAARRLQRR